ncbi:MAG: hypothetical protein IJX19_01015, partial [Clostridia bacterium]|nr:hypothetical protein [Clostridia bacterium]
TNLPKPANLIILNEKSYCGGGGAFLKKSPSSPKPPSPKKTLAKGIFTVLGRLVRLSVYDSPRLWTTRSLFICGAKRDSRRPFGTFDKKCILFDKKCIQTISFYAIIKASSPKEDIPCINYPSPL